MPLLQSLSAVTPRAVSWLWPGRLALGKMTLFDGDPGLGKSLIALDLAARLSCGRGFPGCDSDQPAGGVLILQGEDGDEDTVVPRLQALGANLERTFVFGRDFLDREGPFRLPTHTRILDQAIDESRAAIVIIDPIMAFLDHSIQTSCDTSVRRALSPLAEIAARRGSLMILLRHLNKSGGHRSMYRGGGSIGLLAACRSAFLFAQDPIDRTRSIMAQIKNNLAAPQPSLAYRLRLHESGVPVIDWLGESSRSADVLLAAAGRRPYFAGARERARDFLFAFLEDGPRPTLEIWPAAQEQGLSQRTLRRAHKKANMRTEYVWAGNRLLTYWLLPQQRLPAELTPDRPSLEPFLAPLLEQYPITPLEEDE